MLAPLTFLRGGVLAPFQLGTGVHRSGKTPSIRRGIATKPGLKEFQTLQGAEMVTEGCLSTHLCPLAGYLISLPNSHLTFPGSPAAFSLFPCPLTLAVPFGRYILLAHPCQSLGGLRCLTTLEREPSLSGPFGILGTETNRVMTYPLCACLASPLASGT